MQDNNITYFDRKLGRKLKEARQFRGLTQSELGKQLGVSYQQIQKNESGKSRITAERLQLLGKILKMPLTYFLDVGNETRSQRLCPADVMRLATCINDLPSELIRKNIKNLVYAIDTAWHCKPETPVSD